jgi:DNA (cytosine-5)-methyltransferase 1
MSGAYYNENDPYAAAWLRELIKAGLIADGEVDERSIVDVRPDDLRGFTQCHFFAGIGGWSLALRLAGWPDDREVWTGSCPCQPWSMAGAGGGTDDPRHLWPAWFGLIAQCRPAIVFGEQVASLDGLYWLDLVYRDLEAENYAVGAVDLSGASVGSPDIRSRLWFVAESEGQQQHRSRHAGGRRREPPKCRRDAGLVADTSDTERRPLTLSRADHQHEIEVWPQGAGDARQRGAARGLAHTESSNGRLPVHEWRQDEDRAKPERSGEAGELAHTHARGQRITGAASANDHTAGESHAHECGETERLAHAGSARHSQFSGGRHESAGLAAAGVWSDAEWIPCRDGKYRPTQRGLSPLASGLPRGMGRLSPAQRRLATVAGLDSRSLRRAKRNRIGRLRGYGNAIKPSVAATFIEAYREVVETRCP